MKLFYTPHEGGRFIRWPEEAEPPSILILAQYARTGKQAVTHNGITFHSLAVATPSADGHCPEKIHARWDLRNGWTNPRDINSIPSLLYALSSDRARGPAYGTEHSGGLDVSINHPLAVQPYFSATLHTGLHVEIPPNHVGLLTIRSSLAKEGLILLNAPGVIDADYRGEIKLLAYNLSSLPIHLSRRQRVAQLLILPYRRVCPVEVGLDDLSPTARGEGGFGSTGR